jgi:hypothetical protein
MQRGNLLKFINFCQKHKFFGIHFQNLFREFSNLLLQLSITLGQSINNFIFQSIIKFEILLQFPLVFLLIFIWFPMGKVVSIMRHQIIVFVVFLLLVFGLFVMDFELLFQLFVRLLQKTQF